jgi:hypothetical protein
VTTSPPLTLKPPVSSCVRCCGTSLAALLLLLLYRTTHIKMGGQMFELPGIRANAGDEEVCSELPDNGTAVEVGALDVFDQSVSYCGPAMVDGEHSRLASCGQFRLQQIYGPHQQVGGGAIVSEKGGKLKLCTKMCTFVWGCVTVITLGNCPPQ